jgi:hypothetical protein
VINAVHAVDLANVSVIAAAHDWTEILLPLERKYLSQTSMFQTVPVFLFLKIPLAIKSSVDPS